MKYAQHKVSFICIAVYEIYEGNGFNESFEVSAKLKNKNFKINVERMENYKNLDENFEQVCSSKKAKSRNCIGKDSFRLMKWMAYYDQNHENIIYFGLMANVSSCLNGISRR